MIRKYLLAMVCSLALLGFSVGCENAITDSLDEDSQDQLISELYETAVDDELSKVSDNGANLEGVDAVFSLGWHPFYNPREEELQIRSDAFAVALNSDTSLDRRHRAGKDMGTVTLQFSEGELELNKIELPNGGVVYNIGKRMHGRKGGFGGGKGHHGPGRGPGQGNQGGFGPGNFGGPQGGKQGGFGQGNVGGVRPIPPEGEDVNDVEIPFIPGDTYSFIASGSDDFTALTVSITAPAQALQITSPAQQGSVSATEALTVTWEGGAVDGKLVIGLLPVFNREDSQGPFGRRGPRGRRGGFHEKPNRYEIETNTGEYTIPVEDIQTLASDENISGIIVQVMQMVQQETELDGAKYVSNIRTGDQVVLAFEE